jgi:long-chain acyl-CoA synthetase
VLLHESFEQTAQRLPGKIALVEGDRRVTYGELLQRCRALAQALRDDGVVPGDRVVLLLENCIEYAVAVHAVLMAGAVFVPLHPMAKSEKITFIASDTRATALLTHALLAPEWATAIVRSPHLVSCRVVGALGGSVTDSRLRAWPEGDSAAGVSETPRIDQDLAALIYTSGTTGTPKGVMLTHLNMTSAWNSVQSYLGLREDDITGLALPPAFSYGLYNLLMGLGLGATVILERLATFPLKMAGTLERERVTVFPGVPTLFAALLGVPGLSKFDLGSIRIFTNAAAALPHVHLMQLRQTFPNAQLFSMYGLTECKRVSYLPPEQIETRPGSVGRGMPNQEHWLIDEEGRRLPNGSTGELVVRGSHVMLGYWDRPVETNERLKPGPIAGERVLHTGDLFRTDNEGYLYFLARKDDIIKSRGEKVAPREIENVIHQLDDVTGCAVIGIDDDALGQAVKAYVTLHHGSRLTERDIIRHCLAHLENYMAPKFVEIVEELPRTESGKVRHASLRRA